MPDPLADTIATFAATLRALGETPRLVREWPSLLADIERPTETLLRFVAARFRDIATETRHAVISAGPEEVATRMSAASRADGLAVAFEWLSAALRAAGPTGNRAAVARLALRARKALDASLVAGAGP